MLFYWFTRAMVIGRFVPLRFAYWVTATAADLAWWVLPRKRAAAIENLTQALADRQAARSAARRAFRNYGRFLVDFVRAPLITPDALADKVRFENWGAVDAAFAEGRGVIFVLMHFGNWEMGAAVLADRGHPLHVVAQTFAYPPMNRHVVSERRTRGMNVIPAENAALKIVRALRRGEALAILIDRPMVEGGVLVNFFGRPAWVPAGPARIALRTGARVIPVALVRTSEHTDTTRALADLDLRWQPTGDTERDVAALTRRILESHERFVRAHPDQWFIFRPMWSAAEQPVPAAPPLPAEG